MQSRASFTSAGNELETCYDIRLLMEKWAMPESYATQMLRNMTYCSLLSVALIRLVPHAFSLHKTEEVVAYLGTNRTVFLHFLMTFPQMWGMCQSSPNYFFRFGEGG